MANTRPSVQSYESVGMNVPASDGNSDEVRSQPEARAYVDVSGTFSATLTVQISPDDAATWLTWKAVTVPDVVDIDVPRTHVRVVVSGYSSGTPVANLRRPVGVAGR